MTGITPFSPPVAHYSVHSSAKKQFDFVEWKGKVFVYNLTKAKKSKA